MSFPVERFSETQAVCPRAHKLGGWLGWPHLIEKRKRNWKTSANSRAGYNPGEPQLNKAALPKTKGPTSPGIKSVYYRWLPVWCRGCCSGLIIPHFWGGWYWWEMRVDWRGEGYLQDGEGKRPAWGRWDDHFLKSSENFVLCFSWHRVTWNDSYVCLL